MLKAKNTAVNHGQTWSLWTLALISLAISAVTFLLEDWYYSSSDGNVYLLFEEYHTYSFACGVAFSACVAWVTFVLPPWVFVACRFIFGLLGWGSAAGRGKGRKKGMSKEMGRGVGRLGNIDSGAVRDALRGGEPVLKE